MNPREEEEFGRKASSHSVDTRQGQSSQQNQRLWLLRLPKKKGFIILSFMLCVLHLAVLCSDIVSHLFTESFNTSSYSFTVILLMSHVVSFYWALLGTIFSAQSGVQHLCLIALLSTVLNLGVIAGRVWFEFIVIQFREEIY